MSANPPLILINFLTLNVPSMVPSVHAGEEGRLRDVHLGRDQLLQPVRDVLLQQADRRRVPAVFVTKEIGESSDI